MIAFAFNPTTDINSAQADAPGDVYTVNGDGSSLRRLTYGLDAGSPSWSPDGKQLAFLRTNWRHGNRITMWVMNADGSGQRPLVGVGVGVTSAPDWSPDGRHIALANAAGVVVVDRPTLRKRHVPFGVNGWYEPDGARWSADGRHLLVSATSKGPGPDDYTETTALFTMDAISGGHAARVPGTKDLLGYDWSWTNCRAVIGQGLATRGGDCNGDLFATDPHLTSTGPLLAAKCRQSFPTWSPDGQRIAFLSRGGLWVAHADGSQPFEVVPPQSPAARQPAGSNAAIHSPDWQPVA